MSRVSLTSYFVLQAFLGMRGSAVQVSYEVGVT